MLLKISFSFTNSKHLCAGALYRIDTETKRGYVITASHCLKNKTIKANEIGYYNLQAERVLEDGTRRAYPVTDLKYHPNYYPNEPTPLLGDLVVLEISEWRRHELLILEEKPMNLANDLYYPNGNTLLEFPILSYTIV